MGMQETGEVLDVLDLKKDFRKRTIINGVTFKVFPGDCIGIFGLRASGKTTLLHILAGLDRFTAGEVKIMGFDINKTDKYKKSIGLVTQVNSLFRDLNTFENLEFIASLKSAEKEKIKELIENFELNDYLGEAASSLDAGVYQRLSMACAMLNSPRLLIVDELIKDIDLYSRHIIIRKMRDFLASGGACVYGFSNMEISEYMSKVGWLDNGRISFYEPRAALERWEKLINSYRNNSGEEDG